MCFKSTVRGLDVSDKEIFMYKDIYSRYITPYCVVHCNGSYYFVEEINPSSGREYFIKLRNGCVVSYAKPEECEVVS
jgi:hypothetical protein